MESNKKWKHFEAVTRAALDTAPRGYLASMRVNLVRDGIPAAIQRRDTAALIDFFIGTSQFQGIADKSAIAFVAKNGAVGAADIHAALAAAPCCPRLKNYWSFADCRLRKAARSCSEPRHFPACPLPTHPARKGSLTVAAYSLFFFVRDVCDGDLIGWIDRRLAESDPGVSAPNRAVRMGQALLEPLRNIYGIGEKVWSMALADLLLAADPHRERWVATGAGMTVIDSLLHNHLHRTGVLRRFGAEHPYGTRCYAPGGCADLIRGLAERIDARQFNPTFPQNFPRFIQFAIWRLSATSESNVCNGNQIDDRHRCGNIDCPAFAACDRVALHGQQTSEQSSHT